MQLDMTYGIYSLLWFYSVIGMVWLIKQTVLAVVWIIGRQEKLYKELENNKNNKE